MSATVGRKRRVTLGDAVASLWAVAEWKGIDVREVSELHVVEATKSGQLSLPARASAVKAQARAVGGIAALREIAAQRPSEAPPGMLPHILPGQTIKGVSTYLGADGEPRGQWVKTQTDPAAALAERVPALIEEIRAAGPLPPVEPPPEAGRSDRLAVYPVSDLHYGMRSWGKETGADWDMGIARQVIGSMYQELSETGASTENALMIFLGDTFEAPNGENRTPASGHALDVDGREAMWLREGLRTTIDMIQSVARKHAEVTVVMAEGNHSATLTAFLRAALVVLFADHPNVTVSESPRTLQIYVFGRCLVAAHHGHELRKPDKAAAALAGMHAEDWGRAKHRIIYSGHVHHTERTEGPGWVAEAFPIIAPPNAWATAHGYIAQQAATRIVLDASHGEVSRSTITTAQIRAQLGV